MTQGLKRSSRWVSTGVTLTWVGAVISAVFPETLFGLKIMEASHEFVTSSHRWTIPFLLIVDIFISLILDDEATISNFASRNGMISLLGCVVIYLISTFAVLNYHQADLVSFFGLPLYFWCSATAFFALAVLRFMTYHRPRVGKAV
jgi:hypothetical protein